MATELRAKLVIDAETEGEKSVEALVIDVEKLAAAGGDAAPQLQLLAAERQVSEGSRAIVYTRRSMEILHTVGVAEAIERAAALLPQPITGLIHGDFRLDNMLFDVKGAAEPIAVLDWQTVALGNGLTDIG